MKKLILILFAFLVTFSRASAQRPTDPQIYLEIQNLTYLKWDYEKFKSFNNPKKTDSVLKLYHNQINKIKKSPEIYLTFINYALKNNKTQLVKETNGYKYVSGLLSVYDTKSHYIKRIDLYRIIKHYIFKRNDELLPENFRGLPVVDEKNYIKQYVPKPGERKAAIKFLKRNLILTEPEIKYIKNRNNIKDVADMKKYLDENGLDSKNKEFIKWAINYLIKRSWVSVGWLENVYNAGHQNPIPRDKEPN